jgi:outer membrane protein assembly factor BamB
MTCRSRLLLLGIALSLGALSHANADDWNQWRGPNRDGKIPGFQAPVPWPKKLTRQWKVEVGMGHASPLVVGNAVFSFARQGEEEIIRRLDLATGRPVWKESYPAPYEMNPAAQDHGKGPKATPVYSDGRLYTFGISGILSCLDAKSGKVLWRHAFAQQYKLTSPLFGTAMSPLVERGLLIAHVGGNDNGALTAFDAITGAVRWRWTGDGPAYASPIVITREGVRQIVTQTQTLCVGIAADTGKLLWSLPFTTPYSQNAVTPVACGDLVVFAGLSQPTFACRIRKSGERWTAEKVWETRDVTLYLSTPVASGSRLYGMSQRRSGQLFSLDAVTGKTLWTDGGRIGENAAVLDAGSSLLILTTGADLIAYKKQGDALAEAARYQVADSPTWATPAVAGPHILIKDATSLSLWDIPARATP